MLNQLGRSSAGVVLSRVEPSVVSLGGPRSARGAAGLRRSSSLLKLEAGRLPAAPLGRSRAAARNGLGDAAAQRRGNSVAEAAAHGRATERGDGQAGAGCM